MNKKNISCDVCLDLIPLVLDKVASDDSVDLVKEHIRSCNNCKIEFEYIDHITESIIDDKKVITSIKNNLYLTGITFIVIGAALGIFISNSFAMFYNFLIMPIVGACSYFTLKNKYYLAPLGIFILSYIWLFIQNIFDGVLSSGLIVEIFLAPLLLSTIYTFLTILGMIISALLKFAFRKEEIKYEK